VASFIYTVSYHPGQRSLRWPPLRVLAVSSPRGSCVGLIGLTDRPWAPYSIAANFHARDSAVFVKFSSYSVQLTAG